MPGLAFLSTAHIHTRDFLKRVNDAENAHVTAIWDDVTDRGQAFAEESSVPFEPDLEAAIGDEAVEGFVVLSETTRHMPLLKAALATGKPVLCEKPLAASAEEAREIGDLVRQHGAHLISGYFQPFFGPNRAARKLIEDGALGRVTHASFRNAHHAAYGHWFDTDALAWFADKELAGGGALMDMGTHALHLLIHLFGPVEKVWALIENLSGIYDTVDDYGLIELRFANGVIGRVEAGWCQNGGTTGLEVFGSDRSIWRRGSDLVIGAPGSEPEPVEALEPRPDRIARLLAVIAGEIDEKELREDLDACLGAVTAMDAAYRSAASGTWVEVG